MASYNINITSKPGTPSTTNNGSRYVQIIKPNLDIPFSKNAKFHIFEVSVFWNIPNISTALKNNSFIFTGATLGLQTFTIDDGLYSVSKLEERINELADNAGWAGTTPYITIAPDQATSKISLQFAENVDINWGDLVTENNLYTIFGFDINVTSNFLTGVWYDPPNIAQFNNTNALLLHCDLAGGNTYFNDQGGSDVVAVVIPDVAVGSQIKYRPFHAPFGWVNRYNVSQITYYWTNEKGEPVDLRNEPFTIFGRITFDE